MAAEAEAYIMKGHCTNISPGIPKLITKSRTWCGDERRSSRAQTEEWSRIRCIHESGMRYQIRDSELEDVSRMYTGATIKIASCIVWNALIRDSHIEA